MEYSLFVGIDWATKAHQVCVLGPDRKVRLERSIEHSASSLGVLIDSLLELVSSPEQIAVAIEIPRGPIVEGLVERGFHVFAINPKQLDRFRDRHSPAGAKDDRRDALVLADSLRTDRLAFRQVRLDDPLIVQLREVSRLHDDVVEDLSRLSNRLREQLHRFYPQALALCEAANEPWLWTLLEIAPTPAEGARLRLAEAKRILRSHKIRRFNAEELLASLKTAAFKVAPGATEAAVEHISMLLPRLRLAYEQNRRCEKRIEKLLATLTEDSEPGQQNKHRDAQILLSLPGVGRIVGATMLGEASQLLKARDYQTLRAQAGSAPVTRQSGKSTVVSMRRGCNTRLRNALYYWAKNAVLNDPRWKAAYEASRARGHRAARAYRAVADKLLNVLIAMLKNGTEYDPSYASRAGAAA